MTNIQPTLFISHGGGPSFFLDATEAPFLKGLDKDSRAVQVLRNLTNTIGLRRPVAILVISAHWDEHVCTINTKSKHSLYHDFENVAPGVLSYPVPGAPEVAKMAKGLLEQRGIICREEKQRGLDHGVFVPLKVVFPKADIPVCELSLLSSLRVKDHLHIAEALYELTQHGVLVIGSGFATHNLSRLGRTGAPTPRYVLEFKNWLNDVLLNTKYSSEERKRMLLDCERTAPNLQVAHDGRLDHFLPLVMCCAAAGYRPAKLLHSEVVLETCLNEHYMFPTI